MVKTVGFYSAQFFCPGGAEKVAERLNCIFRSRDIKTWAVCEHGTIPWLDNDEYIVLLGLSETEKVKRIVERARIENTDLFIIHYTASENIDEISAVIDQLHAIGVKVVAVCHSPLTSALLFEECIYQWRDLYRYYCKCDMVAAINEMDMYWWRSLGCRVMLVQNPVSHPDNPMCHSAPQSEVRLLWVGRNCAGKNPDIAIRAFQHVLNDLPNARLTLVGGLDKEWNRIRKLAKELDIGDRVECLSQRNNIGSLWDVADFHILTSITESFSLVLAEAKSRGIPTVLFDIQFSELVKDKRGIIEVPYGDVQAMGAAIVKAVSDAGLYERLSRGAVASMAPYNDDMVWQDWEALMNALSNDSEGRYVNPKYRMLARQVFFCFNDMMSRSGWRFDMETQWRRISGCSLRLPAKIIDALMRVAKTCRRVIHGSH